MYSTFFLRNLVFFLCLFPVFGASEVSESPLFLGEFPGEFSGVVNLENRYYPEKSLFNDSKQIEASLVLQPQYSYSWNDDRKVITFTPFLVLNTLDSEKTHADIRELSFLSAWEYWDLRLGVSKVFFGVTEFQHLLDVVNQTDAALNPDGEDKLGQPMLNATLITDYGNLDLFLLPYFRERSFPGKKGRLRGPLPIDTDEALYEHGNEERHLDVALRYSHQKEALEWGLSYFRGTDREPTFVLNEAQTALRPFYGQMEQVGLDFLWVHGNALFKWEGLKKKSFERYWASSSGLEYTFSNIHKGWDVGVLLEHLYDDRGETSSAVFYDHTFLGTRLAFNDEFSFEVLLGGGWNNEDGEWSHFRLESSRRMTEHVKWELEANAILYAPRDSVGYSFRKDDYVQCSLSYYI